MASGMSSLILDLSGIESEFFHRHTTASQCPNLWVVSHKGMMIHQKLTAGVFWHSNRLCISVSVLPGKCVSRTTATHSKNVIFRDTWDGIES